MKNEMFYLDDSELAIAEEKALREVLGDEGYKELMAEREAKKRKAKGRLQKKSNKDRNAEEK